jgi:hypothetical protein
MTNIEDRLRSAVRAEVDTVALDELGSLDAIRGRVRVARRRRLVALGSAAALLTVAAAVALPRLDDLRGTVDMAPADRDETPSTPPPSTSPPSTSDATTPSTTVTPAPAPSALDQALWPDPDVQRFTDPSEAARSFVEDYLGIADPPLSEFRADGQSDGAIDVFGRGENGQTLERVVTTIVLRRLDAEHWFVIAAVSQDVTIDSPRPDGTLSSPVTVTGQGRGYEGTVIVSLRERFASDTLAERPTIAGCCETLEPYSVELSFQPPTTSAGVILAGTDSGGESSFSSFAAVGVHFGGPARLADDTVPSAPTSASGFRFQPLWPFATATEVEEWLVAFRTGGHQPWHLDPDQTALGFTSGFLDFAEIDRVISHQVSETEADVSVGYATEGGGTATAAVIHLVRWGTGADAPWEVVGTADTDLTLETPRYGATVSSPVTVGGHITGVDENLRVQVRQLWSPQPLGSSPSVPGGGENSRWETTVEFSGATDPALTIVVSTGGHYQGIERFAITGVRRR